jgi:aminobutyraldehyde dehydrogenase
MTTTTGRRASIDDIPSGTALGHVIGGVIEPAGTDLLEVLDPCTGTAFAWVARGTAADVDRAVAAARAALPAWRALTPAERSKILTAVADVVDAHVDELVALESRNVGKPSSLAAEEIPGVSEVLRFMAGAARALQAPATEEYLAGHVSMLRREPHGVIGAVTPWNYPLMTASWKIAAALAMGNTMVLKPSELTPLTTLRFMELVADVLPAGVVNVVVGTGPEVGAAIAAHSDIDMVSLTGSVASGQAVMADAAKTLKPVHLELGGKAPVVVFADADLDAVVATVRMAGFVNSGQECGAATRILCDRTVSAELTRKLADAVSTLSVGSPDESADIEMGPLVSEAQLHRVSAIVDRAREAGATIAVGGHRLDRDGFFYAPTVIAHTDRGAEITVEEVFGPVVTVETFDGEADAITLANSTRYGLASSVWTQNIGRALRLSSALDFGTVWVNTHLALAMEMPWVGFGASGHGRECSTLALEDFSRTKHVMIATEEA